MREKIPKKIDAEILFKNKHTCCICNEKGKDVQIHHIDGNPGNNDISNLAVVCLDCHSKITGKRGLGRAYTPEEIRLFKRKWEYNVRTEKSIKSKIVYKETISQVDLIICEILAYQNYSFSKIDVRFNLLEEMELYFGTSGPLTKRIIKGYEHLAIAAGVYSKNISLRLIKSLDDMFGFYPGPEELKLSIQDKQNLLKVMGILGTIGDFSSEFLKNREVTMKFCKSLESFFEIAKNYRFKRMQQEIMKIARDSLKTAKAKDESGKEGYTVGAKIISNLITRINRKTKN